MTEKMQQNNADIGKMFRTLKKRSSYGTRSQSSIRKEWPTSLPFSILNNMDRIARKAQPKAEKMDWSTKTQSIERRQTRQATLNTISMVSFSRPQTTSSQGRKARLTEKSQAHLQKTSLFDFVKQQKLVRLEQQKHKLMSTMFNEQAQIHRLDQDEDGCDKPNAINFKAFQFLNRLMDIKEQIYHTSNYRPKTSGQPLRKRRNRQLY